MLLGRLRKCSRRALSSDSWLKKRTVLFLLLVFCMEKPVPFHVLEDIYLSGSCRWKMRLVICVKSEAMMKSSLSRVSAQALDFFRLQEAAEVAVQDWASPYHLLGTSASTNSFRPGNWGVPYLGKLDNHQYLSPFNGSNPSCTLNIKHSCMFCMIVTYHLTELQWGYKREACCGFRKHLGLLLLCRRGMQIHTIPRAKVKQLFFSVSARIVPAALCAVLNGKHLSHSTPRAQLCLKDMV